MSNRKAIGIIAGVIAIIGLAIGLWPLSTDQGYLVDGSRDVSCGSAFTGLSDDVDVAEFGAAVRDVYAGGDGDDGGLTAICTDALFSQRALALITLGVGAAVLLFIVLTGDRARQTAT